MSDSRTSSGRALSYAHGGVFSPISSNSIRRSGVSLSKRILVISAPRRDTGFRFSRTWPTGSVRTLVYRVNCDDTLRAIRDWI